MTSLQREAEEAAPQWAVPADFVAGYVAGAEARIAELEVALSERDQHIRGLESTVERLRKRLREPSAQHPSTRS